MCPNCHVPKAETTRYPLTRSGALYAGRDAVNKSAPLSRTCERKNFRPQPTTIRAISCNIARIYLHEHAVQSLEHSAKCNLFTALHIHHGTRSVMRSP